MIGSEGRRQVFAIRLRGRHLDLPGQVNRPACGQTRRGQSLKRFLSYSDVKDSLRRDDDGNDS